MTIRIVLADDHPIFRRGLRSLLDAEPGVKVVAEVGEGIGAVEAVRTQKPDVVIIDVAMPGMNGLESTRRILDERSEVNVLCVSMHSDKRFVESAFRNGARGYLLKECALEDLVAAVRAVVAGQIFVSPGLANKALGGYNAQESEGSALSALTPREREVLQLLAEGHSTSDIAKRLHVSGKTVSSHREHLMQKLGTHSLAGLTKFAIREGLTSADQ